MRAGRAEQDRAAQLGEGQQHDAADERQCGDAGRRGERVAARGHAVEQTQVDRELRDEAAQGRQGAYRRRAREQQAARQGHVAHEAAQAVEGCGAGLREDVAGAEEEQRLEARVVDGVEQRAGDAAERHGLVSRALAQCRRAQAQQDDADVLDRGVGQQTLDVVLRGREDRAPQAGRGARREQHEARRAQFGQAAQGGRDAQDAVYARLDHHARHERRDVRRGCGVCLRQPHVHGEEAGFHAESREEEHEERQRAPLGEAVAQRGEVARAARGVEPHEAHDQQRESYVHHQQVGERRAQHLAPLGVVEDQQERGHGHQLPAEEERVAAVRAYHAQHGEAHRGQGGVVERYVGRRLVGERMLEVAVRVEHRGDGPDGDHEREERREGVHRPRVAAEEGAGGGPEAERRAVGQYAYGACGTGQCADADQRERRPRLGAQRHGEDQRR